MEAGLLGEAHAPEDFHRLRLALAPVRSPGHPRAYASAGNLLPVTSLKDAIRRLERQHWGRERSGDEAAGAVLPEVGYVAAGDPDMAGLLRCYGGGCASEVAYPLSEQRQVSPSAVLSGNDKTAIGKERYGGRGAAIPSGCGAWLGRER